MPKIALQEEYKYVSNKSPRFTRAPIRSRGKNEEEIIDDDEEEEEEENYSNIHKKNLYPDLGKDLHEMHRTTKSKDSRKTYQHETTKSKEGESGRKAKQLVICEKSDSDTSIFKYVICLLVVIVAVILGFFAYNTTQKTSDKINVVELVADLQNHFQEQQPYTFNVLKTALRKIVNDKPEPSAPAIFTVIANKGAEKTASDFSVHLANALAPGNFVSINDSLQWRNNPEQLKFKIDNKIKSKLEKDILNVVIVDRLNDVPIDAAMIFHSFCDHEYAPYKRAVYLFIVHLDRTISKNLTPKKTDTVATESLRDIWRTSTDDIVDSLITRLTVNVVSII